MKLVVYILASAGAFFFTSCSSKQPEEKQETATLMKEEMVAEATPIRMQHSKVKENISLNKKEYTSIVTRQPDDNLPMVENEEGAQFVDNKITLQINCGEKQIVNKVFDKESFANIVDYDFRKKAILEGLVFDRVAENALLYVGSVGHPNTDLYIPIRVAVSPNGKITITREEVMEERNMEEQP